MSDALTRLRRLARPMAWAATLALVLIPLFWGIGLVSGEYRLNHLEADLGIALPDTVPTANVIAVHASGAVAVALLLMVIWNMRRLFLLFARGDVFGPEAAQTIRRIGMWMLATALFGVVNRTFSVLILTLANPSGQRSLSIGFSSQDVFLMISAGLLVAIGWAMSEAARLADENRSFV